MEFIVFYTYDDGSKYFNYFETYEEAKESYDDAIEQAQRTNTKLEVGIANVTDVFRIS